MRFKVALLGFSAFERSALDSYFRLSADRTPAYDRVNEPAQADYLVADADRADAVAWLLEHDRLADAVFIGSQAPVRGAPWTMRPIDPLHVMHQLDALAAQHGLPRDAGDSIPPEPVPPAAPARRAAGAAAPLQRRASDSRPGAFDDTASQPAVRPRRGAVPPAPSRVTTATHGALLVDDSEVALRFAERELHALGLTTQCSTNSAQAIELLAHQRFEVVLIDVELGDDSRLDGLGLCWHLKHRHRHPNGHAPVIVLVSAHDGAVDRVRGTLAGCDAYLGKPLDGDELRRTLQRHGVRLAPPAHG